MSVKSLHGAINILRVVVGTLDLKDIVLETPAVNIVQVKEGLTNYDIFPESTDTTKSELPKIILNYAKVVNRFPVRYYDHTTKTAVAVDIDSISIYGQDAPVYHVNFDSHVNMDMLEEYSLNGMRLAADGDVEWDGKSQFIFDLKDVVINADLARAVVNGQIDVTDGAFMNSLKMNVDPIPVQQALKLIPAQLRNEYHLENISTDMKVGVTMALNRRYDLTSAAIPYATLNFSVPLCSFNYGPWQFPGFDTNIKVELNGDNLDKAVVTIPSFNLKGVGLDMSLTGSATNLITDPSVDGCFKGNADLSQMPKDLYAMAQGSLRGLVDFDFDAKLKQSQLTRSQFHNVVLTGDMNMNNLRYQSFDNEADYYVHNGAIHFGTNDQFVHDSQRATNLMTASIKVDSANILQSVIALKVIDMKAGVGTSNKKRSNVTTEIIPFGGTFKVAKMELNQSTDSMRMRTRELMCYAVMRRYEGNAHRPQFTFHINADRVSAGDPTTRMMISKPTFDVSAHPLDKAQLPKRVTRMADSLKQVYPHLAMDSIYRMAFQKQRRSTDLDEHDQEMLDFEVSEGIQRFLQCWSLNGTMTAGKARLFTPYFPLRNRFADINLGFTTDSVNLRSLKYNVGHSDFSIVGSITNLKRALTSHRHSPLKIKFDVQSDSIDVNELAEAAFAGSAYAENANKTDLGLGDTENEAALEKKMQEAQTDSVGPFLVPTNIDANLSMRARNVTYSDFIMHDFGGSLLAYDGAINMRNLSATSDIGGIDMSALYTAPTVEDMRFGFDLKVKNFYIDRFLNLIPAVDSLMPLMRDISGIITADVVATSDIDRNMDFVLPSVHAAIKLEGDSLVLLDAETFRTISKWLLFKNKEHNMIDHMAVELLVEDSQLEMFPFMFDFDRYRLGVMGYNDMALNYKYHIGVIKSPIPFKFGINVSGTGEKMKIRLGRNKFNNKNISQRVAIVDTTRVNLLQQIESVFRRGVRRSKLNSLNISAKRVMIDDDDLAGDTISHADSLLFIQEGLLPAPPAPVETETTTKGSKKSKKKKNSGAVIFPLLAILPEARRLRKEQNSSTND
jgi:hypothetical protein